MSNDFARYVHQVEDDPRTTTKKDSTKERSGLLVGFNVSELELVYVTELYSRYLIKVFYK
jgi:hypothetical protein